MWWQYVAKVVPSQSRREIINWILSTAVLEDQGLGPKHLAYSRRGTPKSHLFPPAVVAPVVSYGPSQWLTYSRRGIAKPHLPTVVVSVVAQIYYGPTVHLVRRPRPVAKSVLRAGTGNNDLNYFSEMYPGMKVVYSPFLDSTSTTAYFLGSQTHGIMRAEREAFFTDLVDWKTQPNDQYIYKMRAREVVDSIEYSGLVGSSGTTA